MLAILLNDIVPILIVAGVGYLLAGVTRIDVKPVARVAFHVFAPCLIFMLLVTSTARGSDLAQMAVFCVLVLAASGVVARLAAIPFGLNRAALAGFVLASLFANNGNFGLALVEFAFGREALVLASVYFVTAAALSYTVGVLIASSGTRSVGAALRGVARVPAVYGLATALVVMGLDVQVPVWLMRPVTLLGSASIPVMLLVLGMQLERTGRPARPGVIAVLVAIALLVKPLLAIGLAEALQLEGPARQAAIVQSSMPTAVVATVLAIEFDAAADLVTAAVFYSMLLSPFTLTVLVAWLQ